MNIEQGETSNGGITGFVYLIHFSEPIHHARHYLGFTTDLEKRLERHKKGHGSKLIAEAVKRGITLEVVKVWEGDRNFERKLKNRKNSPRVCPICRQK